MSAGDYVIQDPNYRPITIPVASTTSPGVMSAADKAKLNNLAAPGAWVGLNYAGGGGGYTDGTVPAQSRVNGDYVQLRGTVKNPNNKSALSPIALLPAGQVPSKPRLISLVVTDGTATPNILVVDDGSQFGMPGLVLLNFAYSANNTIPLDGLSFSL